MKEKLRLKVNKDEVTILEGENSTLGKLIAGAKGNVTIKTPFGIRVIKSFKNSKGEKLKKPKK